MIRAIHMRPAIPVTGRVVAITGGARGIGRATANALVAKAARVAIGDLDLDLAQVTATDLGRDVIATHLDVTDRTSFAAFLDETEDQLGPLDVLINNAGIMPIGPRATSPTRPPAASWISTSTA